MNRLSIVHRMSKALTRKDIIQQVNTDLAFIYLFIFSFFFSTALMPFGECFELKFFVSWSKTNEI